MIRSGFWRRVGDTPIFLSPEWACTLPRHVRTPKYFNEELSEISGGLDFIYSSGRPEAGKSHRILLVIQMRSVLATV